MTYTTVKLGEVADFIRGITFKPDDVVPIDADDAVVCMRTKNVQAMLDRDDLIAVPSPFVRRKDQYLEEGDILVSSANSWNLVGKCCWIPSLPWRAAFGGFISVLRGNPKRVDRRYLYWWFSSERIQALLRSFGQKTTNISNLNIERCLQLGLPLPPLPEQRRIAAILDQADALRAKRREALAELDKLAQSIFVEMFGDPTRHLSSGKYPCTRAKLGDFVKIQTGKLDANAAVVGGKYPFFTCAVKNLEIDVAAFDCKAVLVAGNGDLNVKYYEGKFNAYQRTYVIESNDENKLIPKFLYQFLDIYIAELRKQAIGGVIKYIKLPYLTDAIINLPSIDNQCDFVRLFDTINDERRKLDKAISYEDQLFESLQHRAFRGEL